jgi:integrase
MLSDLAIKSAKPGGISRKLYDHGGLYLLVTPAGGKLWRLKYRVNRREKTLSFGRWPEVSLVDARRLTMDARILLAKGIDPGEEKKRRRLAVPDGPTVELVAREWFARFLPTWAPGTANLIRKRLEQDVIPVLGRRPIADVRAPEVLALLRGIEARSTLSTAHRTRVTVGQVCRYAVATGRAERDPTGDLKGALPPAPEPRHFGAALDPAVVGALLRAQDAYHGSTVVRAALRLAPLVFVRPGELRGARWEEIDLDTATWTIPAARMKGRREHLVPLSRQAMVILRDVQAATGRSPYVFPSARTSRQTMSTGAVTMALRACGYPSRSVTGHGWRATARTLLDEVLGYRVDVIEHQLAHAVRDPLGRAYNRTTHLDERRRMMQEWADYLDGLKG